MALEKGLLGSKGEDIRVHVAGSGRWRQLVIDDLKSTDGYSNSENTNGCKLSLPFARYCLQNVLILLNKTEQKAIKSGDSVTALNQEESDQVKSGKNSTHKNASTGDSKANGDSKENKGTSSSSSILQSSVSAYEDMRREENHMIRQAVLGALAYVELCLENPLKALSFSKSLLDLPECSKIYVFLGHTYASEALCWLNRSKEAAEYLSVYLTDGNNVELPYGNEDREKWFSKRGANDFEDSNSSLPSKNNAEDTQSLMFLKPEEARGIVFANFSAMFAIQRDLEKASRFASEALALVPKHPKALLAIAYVDLLQAPSLPVSPSTTPEFAAAPATFEPYSMVGRRRITKRKECMMPKKSQNGGAAGTRPLFFFDKFDGGMAHGFGLRMPTFSLEDDSREKGLIVQFI
ncbi:CCR4-NOT transcription complex subunit 10-B-like [Asparagus officinalis]|uniref:CCR4-NOT transcription complex subunit 10-B-like n=1 Tax=Asparagus officinalis TaxID=4686 RepID=UPI00098E5D68|nr:CCR4-NOT transcription complex subunit 10-B-like [Asparagus officinalis]